jgi:hypothetical protein
VRITASVLFGASFRWRTCWYGEGRAGSNSSSFSCGTVLGSSTLPNRSQATQEPAPATQRATRQRSPYSVTRTRVSGSWASQRAFWQQITRRPAARRIARGQIVSWQARPCNLSASSPRRMGMLRSSTGFWWERFTDQKKLCSPDEQGSHADRDAARPWSGIWAGEYALLGHFKQRWEETTVDYATRLHSLREAFRGKVVVGARRSCRDLAAAQSTADGSSDVALGNGSI